MSLLSEKAAEIKARCKLETEFSIQNLIEAGKWLECEAQLLNEIENLNFKAKAEETDFCGKEETFFYLLVNINYKNRLEPIIVRIGRAFSNQIGVLEGTGNWETLKTYGYIERQFSNETYENLLVYLEEELRKTKLPLNEIDELSKSLNETKTFSPHQSPTEKLFM